MGRPNIGRQSATKNLAIRLPYGDQLVATGNFAIRLPNVDHTPDLKSGAARHTAAENQTLIIKMGLPKKFLIKYFRQNFNKNYVFLKIEY
jgi:hypothetical protein